MTDLPPAGWYPDLDQPDTQRYWNGAMWTEQRAPMSRPATPTELWFALGATVTVCVGSLGPWISTPFVSANGLDGDGIISLLLGVIALAAVVFAIQGDKGSAAVGALIVCGLGAGATAIYHIVDLYGSETDFLGESVRVANPGWGLWMTAAGAVAMVVSAIAVRKRATLKRL